MALGEQRLQHEEKRTRYGGAQPKDGGGAHGWEQAEAAVATWPRIKACGNRGRAAGQPRARDAKEADHRSRGDNARGNQLRHALALDADAAMAVELQRLKEVQSLRAQPAGPRPSQLARLLAPRGAALAQQSRSRREHGRPAGRVLVHEASYAVEGVRTNRTAFWRRAPHSILETCSAQHSGDLIVHAH